MNYNSRMAKRCLQHNNGITTHSTRSGLSCMLHKNTSLGVILRDNGRIVSMKLLLMKSRGLQPLSVVLLRLRRAQPRPLRTTNGGLSEERRCKNCVSYLTPFRPQISQKRRLLTYPLHQPIQIPPHVVKINIGLPKAQKYLTGYPTKAAELEYSLLSECAHLRYKAWRPQLAAFPPTSAGRRLWACIGRSSSSPRTRYPQPHSRGSRWWWYY